MLSPVGAPRVYYHIVAHIERAIYDGRLECGDKLPPERVIACVVYPAAEIVAPGTIQHTYSNRFDLGEPDGSKSERPCHVGAAGRASKSVIVGAKSTRPPSASWSSTPSTH